MPIDFIRGVSPLTKGVLVTALVVGVGGSLLYGIGRLQKPESGEIEIETASAGKVLVHVCGEVKKPGVYRFEPFQRVCEAVERAGGPTDAADLNQINMAASLEDGSQLLVPTKGQASVEPPMQVYGTTTTNTSWSTPPPGPGQGVLSLNSATVQDLQKLNGIGPVIAQRIIEYRQSIGGFRSVDQLLEVPGIGPKKLAAIRAYVRP